MRYWLMKSEPSEFSIDDLRNEPEQTACWDGVRNYQARNFMRDEMQVGDHVLFYHSNAKPPAVVGLARVAGAAYPDHTAWDPEDKHYDPKSTPDKPIWFMVDVRFEERFEQPVTLPELKEMPELQDMLLLKKGTRLSIQPVTAEQFDTIVAYARTKARSA